MYICSRFYKKEQAPFVCSPAYLYYSCMSAAVLTVICKRQSSANNVVGHSRSDAKSFT